MNEYKINKEFRNKKDLNELNIGVPKCLNFWPEDFDILQKLLDEKGVLNKSRIKKIILEEGGFVYDWQGIGIDFKIDILVDKGFLQVIESDKLDLRKDNFTASVVGSERYQDPLGDYVDPVEVIEEVAI